MFNKFKYLVSTTNEACLELNLNEHANQGWEAISIVPTKNPEYYTIIYKRPVE